MLTRRVDRRRCPIAELRTSVVARAIVDTEHFLAGLAPEDRPARILFVVMTDGEENSSHWYDLADLRAMIAERERSGTWQFVYIGQALEGFSHEAQATSVGIRHSSTTQSSAESYRDVTEITSMVRARVRRDAALRWKGTPDDTN